MKLLKCLLINFWVSFKWFEIGYIVLKLLFINLVYFWDCKVFCKCFIMGCFLVVVMLCIVYNVCKVFFIIYILFFVLIYCLKFIFGKCLVINDVDKKFVKCLYIY